MWGWWSLVKNAMEYRGPKVRCYKCGSSSVKAVCHHCQRRGCVDHVIPAPKRTHWLLGSEGNGPGLKKVPAWHCSECNHVRSGHALQLGGAGLVLTVIGLLVLTVSLAAALPFLVVGIVGAAWAYTCIRRRLTRARATLPVPLNPKVSNVRLLERVRTHITLEAQGVYRTSTDPVEGELRATLTFDRHDRERVFAYRRKRQLSPDQEVPYSAGCFLPRGRVGIRELTTNPIVRLTGDAREIPAFGKEDAPASSRRNVALRYRLSKEPDFDAAPFWIVPSIAPESEKHVLEIDIQWTEFGSDKDAPLDLEVIDLLTVAVPVAWGTVEDVNHGPIAISASDASDGDAMFQTLEWKQLSPDRHEREARHLTIAVQFENSVIGEDKLLEHCEPALSGRLEATMKGPLLSGVDGLRLYSALGARRSMSGTCSVKTKVEADFTLSLASVRYQAVRVSPNREDEDIHPDRYTVEFDAIPDDETVIALTNALAENDFYVKRVTEHPPRSGGRADVINRYWSIAGRSYEGLHPVDFHLVVTGEEVHRGDVRPESGKTKIRITVRGVYTNADMSARVDNEWTRLREVTNDALKAHISLGHGPIVD